MGLKVLPITQSPPVTITLVDRLSNDHQCLPTQIKAHGMQHRAG